MKQYNVLVVDDDKEITEAIEIYLTNEGYNVFKANDGIEALEIIKNNEVHLVLLDIMMPKMDGTRVTVKIREELEIPIIMLSAKSEDTDKVMGLNLGADDYITKPFNPLELIARVNSQIRRYTRFSNFKKNEDEIVIGTLILDKAAKKVSVDGEEVYERVWNEPAYNVDTVAVHVRHIREKIEINPKEPRYLKVVWGIGYKIER